MGCGIFVHWLICVYIINIVVGIQWLALSKGYSQWIKPSHCVQASKQNLIAEVQKKSCKRYLDVMPILSGIGNDVAELCQELFEYNRWNCSSITTAPQYTPDLLKAGTREQAYVYALSSAAIVHRIARYCSEGRLNTCSCGKSTEEPLSANFMWGGCADNIRHGILMAKAFTEEPYNRRKFRRDIKVRINRHNSRTGWRSLHNAATIQCKCQGVSGSCVTKTCWLSLIPLKDLAARLKRKYQQAEEVFYRRVGGGTRWKLFPVVSTLSFSKDDLIYSSKSPDYCNPDPGAGSRGTRGRLCKKKLLTPGSCVNMCCGRGYETIVSEYSSMCNCKYRWCCFVTCDVCVVNKSVYRCL